MVRPRDPIPSMPPKESAEFDDLFKPIAPEKKRGKSALEKALNKTANNKALATVLDAFLHMEKRVYDVAEMTEFMGRGRNAGNAGVWKLTSFTGGEKINFTTAYVLDNNVYMTGAPLKQSAECAFVRVTFSQAVDFLNGFNEEFNEFLETADASNLPPDVIANMKAAEQEAFERARIDAGDNPDFGTW